MFVKSILSAAILIASANAITTAITKPARSGVGTFCKASYFSGADRSSTKKEAYKLAVRKWKRQAQENFGLKYNIWHHARYKTVSCHDSVAMARIGKRSNPRSGKSQSKNWACTVEARPCHKLIY